MIDEEEIKKKILEDVQKLASEIEIGSDEIKALMDARLSMIPEDHVMTRVVLKRAEYEARDCTSKYCCPMCLKEHDKKDDIIDDVQEHVIDFLAGVPIEVSDEVIEKNLNMMPSGLRTYYHDMLNKKREEKEG